jgi:ATP-dependent RNA helicase RhlE
VFLIKQKDLQQVLVFTRTKQGADRLTKRLSDHGISSAAIHGDRNQLQRTQALDSFKQGLIRVLVATDVAARGLDIEELTYVINFELPNNPEDYVHRIGRTGRAGVRGFAISLVSREENKLMINLEKLLKTKIKIEEIDGFEFKKQQLHISDNKISTEEKKPKRTGLSTQNKKKVSSVKDSEGATIRFNAEMLKKGTRRTEKREDPLFTEPYVPKFSATQIALVEQDELSREKIAHHHNRHRQSNRSLPALFIFPVASKQK